MRNKELEILAGSRLLGRVPEDRLEEWLNSEGTVRLAAKKGETMLSTAELRRGLTVLLRGEAMVYKRREGGKRVIMSRLVPGDVFGMTTLFYEPDEVPTEVEAAAPCSLIVFTKPLVERMLDEYPPFARDYIALLSERIHFLGRRLGTFTEGDTAEKLLGVLRGLPYAGGAVELPYSMTQLAGVLGVGRASLYRAVDALEAEGVFARKGRFLTILQPEKLGFGPAGEINQNDER